VTRVPRHGIQRPRSPVTATSSYRIGAELRALLFCRSATQDPAGLLPSRRFQQHDGGISLDKERPG